jgi:hypothetical protein
MGLIVNPRGAGGSGKTELIRRVLAEYGRTRTAAGPMDAIYRKGRSKPFALRLPHPCGERPLVVLGHYERTSGGCDTIRAADGGIHEIMRTAGELATNGHDVIIEGLQLSSEIEQSASLAASHHLHILLLSTSVECCVQNLIARRRLGKSSLSQIRRNTVEEHKRIEEACERLRPHATVEVLDFQQAFARIRELLKLISRDAKAIRAATPVHPQVPDANSV